MFSKKPYGPAVCASCDKNVLNLHGGQVDFNSWKKLPYRDPGDRIARFGQGFSKILTQMQKAEALKSESSSPNRGKRLRRNPSVDQSGMTHHGTQSALGPNTASDSYTVVDSAPFLNKPSPYKTRNGHLRRNSAAYEGNQHAKYKFSTITTDHDEAMSRNYQQL